MHPYLDRGEVDGQRLRDRVGDEAGHGHCPASRVQQEDVETNPKTKTLFILNVFLYNIGTQKFEGYCWPRKFRKIFTKITY